MSGPTTAGPAPMGVQIHYEIRENTCGQNVYCLWAETLSFLSSCLLYSTLLNLSVSHKESHIPPLLPPDENILEEEILTISGCIQRTLGLLSIYCI